MNHLRNAVCLVVSTLVLSSAAQAGWQGSASADYAVKATVDSFVGKAVSEPIAIADGATEFPVTFLISKLAREEGKLSFVADLEISLKSFGLKPPSIMKIINVADLVKVTATFALTSSSTPAVQP